jgi:hypothetical protein
MQCAMLKLLFLIENFSVINLFPIFFDVDVLL